MKLCIVLAGGGLLLAGLAGCTVVVDDEPSATPQPEVTPSQDVHSIYGVLPDTETGHPLDQTFLYEGSLSEIESFCLFSDSEMTCTSDVEEIAAALELPDLPGDSMAQFIGLPLFAVTDDGRMWGVRQPADRSGGGARAELAHAIENADWDISGPPAVDRPGDAGAARS